MRKQRQNTKTKQTVSRSSKSKALSREKKKPVRKSYSKEVDPMRFYAKYAREEYGTAKEYMEAVWEKNAKYITEQMKIRDSEKEKIAKKSGQQILKSNKSYKERFFDEVERIKKEYAMDNNGAQMNPYDAIEKAKARDIVMTRGERKKALDISQLAKQGSDTLINYMKQIGKFKNYNKDKKTGFRLSKDGKRVIGRDSKGRFHTFTNEELAEEIMKGSNYNQSGYGTLYENGEETDTGNKSRKIAGSAWQYDITGPDGKKYIVAMVYRKGKGFQVEIIEV